LINIVSAQRISIIKDSTALPASGSYEGQMATVAGVPFVWQRGGWYQVSTNSWPRADTMGNGMMNVNLNPTGIGLSSVINAKQLIASDTVFIKYLLSLILSDTTRWNTVLAKMDSVRANILLGLKQNIISNLSDTSLYAKLTALGNMSKKDTTFSNAALTLATLITTNVARDSANWNTVTAKPDSTRMNALRGIDTARAIVREGLKQNTISNLSDTSLYAKTSALNNGAHLDTVQFKSNEAAKYAPLISPSFTTPVLGTVTSGNFGSGTFTWPTFNQATSSTAANLSGTPALPNGTTATTQASGSNDTKIATNAYVDATGGWTTYKVASSDFTRTAQTLADITGLVTGTLTNATLYEFQATLYCTTSAVTTGVEFGVNLTGTSSPTAQAIYEGAVTSTTAAVSSTNALATADATAFLTTSAAAGCVTIKGTFQTGTSSAFSIQGLKVTSGTLTVKIGSTLRIRKM